VNTANIAGLILTWQAVGNVSGFLGVRGLAYVKRFIHEFTIPW